MTATRSLLVGMALLALASCSGSAQPPVLFTDDVSGFTVTKPAGWFMQSGTVLKAQTLEEARRLKDQRLEPRPEGGPIQTLVRITRYEPGKASRPNPTAVFVRFDLRRFPAGTGADDLLLMGVATARVEKEPVTMTFGGRPWRRLVATRPLTDPSGRMLQVRQEMYVTVSDPWAIGLTVSAMPEQFTEFRAAFDDILRGARPG